MTLALPVYRGLSTKFAGRSFQVVTRWGYNPWLARVDQRYDSTYGQTRSQKSSFSSGVPCLLSRSYATSTRTRPVSRPKANSSRTPAKRSTKPAAKKPGPKTPAGKKKVGRKPKTKAKPQPRKIAKAPSQTALNQKRIAKEKGLKEKALLDEPKPLPATPWKIIFSETHKKAQVRNIDEGRAATKEAAEKLRNLTPEEKEHYNHEAHLAKEKNDKAHQKWLSQYSPEQIREANNARNLLTRLNAAKKPNVKSRSRKYPHLKDDRLVKSPRAAYVYFTKDRHASGDFARMAVSESGKLIGREWKALIAAEKKPFEDQAQADLNRYREEVQSVYGPETKIRTRKSS